MKKILMGCIWMLLLLTGCSNGYTRDTTPGETIMITLSDMQKMMEEEQEFAIVFTQSMCGYCQEYHELFEEYAKNHHVIMYEVLLDNETASPRENRALIQQYFPGFDTTPGIFYAKDGACVNQLNNSQRLTEEIFDNWVQKNQLDEKK